MARNSALSRALFRATGADSADDRDVARALRRALKHAARLPGDPQPTQGRYALVLVALDPATTERFIRHGSGRQLTPPAVGEFQPAVESTVALAATLASWIELLERPVALAPPLLHTGQGWRLAQLGHQWPLAPYRHDL